MFNQNKTVLITGSTRHIGFAIAERFAQQGATVALNSRVPEDVHQALEACVMKIGIGSCNKRNPFDAGTTIAEEAVREGNIDNPTLAIAFCSGQLDHAEFLRGIKETIGDIPVVGGSTIGIITNDALSYKDYPSKMAKYPFLDYISIVQEERQSNQIPKPKKPQKFSAY